MFERVVFMFFFKNWDESIFEAPKWVHSQTVGPSLKPHFMVCWSKETCMLARKDMLIFFFFPIFLGFEGLRSSLLRNWMFYFQIPYAPCMECLTTLASIFIVNMPFVPWIRHGKWREAFINGNCTKRWQAETMKEWKLHLQTVGVHLPKHWLLSGKLTWQ